MPPRPTVEDVEDIDSNDNELYDNENEKEYEGDGAGSHTKNSAQVATQHTRSLQQFLARKANTKITEKCQNVLNYMKTQALDLTTFLYYISWTIPETTTNGTIKFHQQNNVALPRPANACQRLALLPKAGIIRLHLACKVGNLQHLHRVT
jgi:hypothetical protein